MHQRLLLGCCDHRRNRRLAEEADYCLPFKRAPSSASQHGRSTFSSGKSAFFGRGPLHMNGLRLVRRCRPAPNRLRSRVRHVAEKLGTLFRVGVFKSDRAPNLRTAGSLLFRRPMQHCQPRKKALQLGNQRQPVERALWLSARSMVKWLLSRRRDTPKALV